MNTLELARLMGRYIESGEIDSQSLLLDPDPKVVDGRFMVRIVFYASQLAEAPFEEWRRIRDETIDITQYSIGALIRNIQRESMPVYHHDGNPFTIEQAEAVLSDGVDFQHRLAEMRPHWTSWENEKVSVKLVFPPGVSEDERSRITRAVRDAADS